MIERINPSWYDTIVSSRYLQEFVLSPSMVVVRECASRVEAETIRIRLASDEITAFITGTDAVMAMSMGGAGTDRLVRIEVLEDDAQRAVELLEADELRMEQAGPWICGRCHEQNEASFDLCWSCSKPRSEEDERGREIEEPEFLQPTPGGEFAESISSPPLERVPEDNNPYRPVLISEPPVKQASVPKPRLPTDPEDAASVNRAFYAAIIGMLLLPPLLSLYSLYLLVGLANRGVHRDRSLRKKLYLSWMINLAVVVAVTLFWLQFA